MAKTPVPKDPATSRGTRLGHCLQRFIARCVRAALPGEEVHEDAAYLPHVIRPDLLVGPLAAPHVSVHVTSSDSRDSFRMKKWRYVCELFQLKRFRPQVHSVNVFWGTPELYQDGDVAFLSRLFDSTIDLRLHPQAGAIYAAARARAQESPGRVADDLFAAAAPGFKKEVAGRVRRAVAAPVRAENLPVWRAAARRPAGTNHLPDGRKSLWLPLLLRCLVLTDADVAALKAHLAGRGEPPAAAVELGIVRRVEGLLSDREWCSPAGLRQAFASGRAEKFLRRALAEPRHALLVGEARDAARAAWVRPAFRAVRGGPSDAAIRALLRLGPTHPRFLALDALVAYFGVRVNAVEGYWDPGLCPVGVKNPLANLVNRTPQAGRALADADALARGLLHLWQQLDLRFAAEAARSEERFRSRVQAARRQSLFDQKLIQVAPFAARQIFEEAGWRETGRRRFAFSTRAGGGFCVASEFALTFAKGGRTVLFKSLYGDTGADHKAEENTGKLFLLPFRLRADGVEVSPVAGRPLFVPEGRWSVGQLDLLASAGWDVVGLEDLPAYLNGPA
jgi:hypothetical protein